MASYHLEELITREVFTTNTSVIINLDTWNKLPEHLKKLILDVHLEAEPELSRLYAQQVEDSKKALADAKVKAIRFSPADGDWFVKTIYSIAWADYMKSFPDIGPKMKEMLLP